MICTTSYRSVFIAGVADHAERERTLFVILLFVRVFDALIVSIATHAIETTHADTLAIVVSDVFHKSNVHRTFVFPVSCATINLSTALLSCIENCFHVNHVFTDVEPLVEFKYALPDCMLNCVPQAFVVIKLPDVETTHVNNGVAIVGEVESTAFPEPVVTSSQATHALS